MHAFDRCCHPCSSLDPRRQLLNALTASCYIGCYCDDFNRSMTYLYKDDQNMTIQSCTIAAGLHGYAFAGLQYARE